MHWLYNSSMISMIFNKPKTFHNYISSLQVIFNISLNTYCCGWNYLYFVLRKYKPIFFVFFDKSYRYLLFRNTGCHFTFDANKMYNSFLFEPNPSRKIRKVEKIIREARVKSFYRYMRVSNVFELVFKVGNDSSRKIKSTSFRAVEFNFKNYSPKKSERKYHLRWF